MGSTSHAVEAGANKRADFLTEVLSYLTGRLLQNPRLLYYWDKDGGNLSVYFEDGTKDHYTKNVLHNGKLGKENIDTSGPFGANHEK